MNPKLEWQRAIVSLAAITLVAIVVAALYWARSIFIPLAMGVYLAFVLGPVVAWFERRRCGRVPAVLLASGLAVLAAVGAAGVVGWQLAQLADGLPDYTDNIKVKLTAAKEWAGVGGGENRFERMMNELEAVVGQKRSGASSEPGTVVVVPQGTSWWTRVESFVGPLTEVAGQAAFAFVLAVFMLLKKEDLRNRMIRLTGDTRITTTTKAVTDASRRISRYLFMQLVVNASFGALVAGGLWLGGVKYALLWGALGGMMRYVPYVGTWVGLIPPVVISFAMSDGWVAPLVVIGVIGGLEIINNNVVEPWLYGASMGLSEVAQLVAAAFWAFLWGPVGLILSGPLTVCLLVLGKYAPRFRFLEVLLGDEPALSADVRVYQRLAARDLDEAAAVTREALAAGPPERVFDDVILPALAYVKRDAEEEELSPEEVREIVQLARSIVEEVVEDAVTASSGAAAGVPAGPRVKVLAVPARDETDVVAIELFRALMDATRWEVEVAASASLTSEVVERIRTAKPAVLVVGALAPGGLTHTRYLCKRLRREFPATKLMVGRWGPVDDADDGREQLLAAGADVVAGTLTELRQQLNGWSCVLAGTAAATGHPPGEKSAARREVGTGAAILTAGSVT